MRFPYRFDWRFFIAFNVLWLIGLGISALSGSG